MVRVVVCRLIRCRGNRDIPGFCSTSWYILIRLIRLGNLWWWFSFSYRFPVLWLALRVDKNLSRAVVTLPAGNASLAAGPGFELYKRAVHFLMHSYHSLLNSDHWSSPPQISPPVGHWRFRWGSIFLMHVRLTSLSHDNKDDYKYPPPTPSTQFPLLSPTGGGTKFDCTIVCFVQNFWSDLGLIPHNASGTGGSHKCDPTPQSVHSYGILATRLCKKIDYSKLCYRWVISSERTEPDVTFDITGSYTYCRSLSGIFSFTFLWTIG